MDEYTLDPEKSVFDLVENRQNRQAFPIALPKEAPPPPVISSPLPTTQGPTLAGSFKPVIVTGMEPPRSRWESGAPPPPSSQSRFRNSASTSSQQYDPSISPTRSRSSSTSSETRRSGSRSGMRRRRSGTPSPPNRRRSRSRSPSHNRRSRSRSRSRSGSRRSRSRSQSPSPRIDKWRNSPYNNGIRGRGGARGPYRGNRAYRGNGGRGGTTYYSVKKAGYYTPHHYKKNISQDRNGYSSFVHESRSRSLSRERNETSPPPHKSSTGSPESERGGDNLGTDGTWKQRKIGSDAYRLLNEMIYAAQECSRGSSERDELLEKTFSNITDIYSSIKKNSVQMAGNESTELKTANQELERSQNELKQQNTNLSAELEKVKKELEETQKSRDSFQGDAQVSQKKCEAMTQQFTDAMKQIETLKQGLQDSKKEVAALSTAKDVAEKTTQELNANFKTMIGDREKQISELSLKVNNLNGQLKKCDNARVYYKDKCAKVTEEKEEEESKFKNEIAELHRRIREMSEAEDDLNTKLTSANQLLKHITELESARKEDSVSMESLDCQNRGERLASMNGNLKIADQNGTRAEALSGQFKVKVSSAKTQVVAPTQSLSDQMVKKPDEKSPPWLNTTLITRFNQELSKAIAENTPGMMNPCKKMRLTSESPTTSDVEMPLSPATTVSVGAEEPPTQQQVSNAAGVQTEDMGKTSTTTTGSKPTGTDGPTLIPKREDVPMKKSYATVVGSQTQKDSQYDSDDDLQIVFDDHLNNSLISPGAKGGNRTPQLVISQQVKKLESSETNTKSGPAKGINPVVRPVKVSAGPAASNATMSSSPADQPDPRSAKANPTWKRVVGQVAPQRQPTVQKSPAAISGTSVAVAQQPNDPRQAQPVPQQPAGARPPLPPRRGRGRPSFRSQVQPPAQVNKCTYCTFTCEQSETLMSHMSLCTQSPDPRIKARISRPEEDNKLKKM